MKKLPPMLALLFCLPCSCGFVDDPRGGYVVQTIAGSAEGFRDGPAAGATFSNPAGLAIVGDRLFVADASNGAVRQLDLVAEVVSTLPTPPGTDSDPGFVKVFGIAADDRHPTTLAVVDLVASLLWQLRGDPRQNDWQLEPLAGQPDVWESQDGPVEHASFTRVAGVARDNRADRWFVSDEGKIRVLTAGAVSTLSIAAGDLGQSTWLAYDPQQDRLFAVEDGRHRIVSIDVATASVHPFAGSTQRGFADGPAFEARFASPGQIAYHEGTLFVADTGNNRIRRIQAGVVSTIAGDGTLASSDGPGAAAQLASPLGLALDAQGQLYFSDQEGGLIRVARPQLAPPL